MTSREAPSRLERVLTAAQRGAVELLVARALEEIPVPLVQAALFGSRARGDARHDSDVDVLLVFHRLPPDREPFASQAEELAADVAARTGVPVTVWSVSLEDLQPGWRTPMLVDALRDGIPIWCRGRPLRPVAFTPRDGLRCASALLDRVEEGSEEFATALAQADLDSANRRARDDVVRLCSALLLLRGLTRPRRSGAVHAAVAGEYGHAGPPPRIARVLEWASASFGPQGRDDDGWVAPPPGGPDSVATTIDHLRARVLRNGARLARRLNGNPLRQSG